MTSPFDPIVVPKLRAEGLPENMCLGSIPHRVWDLLMGGPPAPVGVAEIARSLEIPLSSMTGAMEPWVKRGVFVVQRVNGRAAYSVATR